MKSTNLQRLLVAAAAANALILVAPSTGMAFEFEVPGIEVEVPGIAVEVPGMKEVIDGVSGVTAPIEERARSLVEFRIVIHNRTPSVIHYVFNGQTFAHPPKLTETWTGHAAGPPKIKFDNGNSQDIKYALKTNNAYSFNRQNNVLQLTKD